MVGALSVLVLGLTAAAPIEVPPGTPRDGLLELTAAGELFLLAEHNARQFRALLITQASERCADIEAAMMDVEGYPKRWAQMQDIEAKREGPNRVRYSYELDMMFSPRLEGIVERPRPGMVRYVSDETPSDFTWLFFDASRGKRARCHMVHRMVQPPGVRSDFVRLIEKLEPGTNDAAELAGALAASRGWAENATTRTSRSAAGDEAWARMSSAGTTIHLINRPKAQRMLVRAGRRVAASPERVLAQIRDRAAYPELGVDFLDDVEVHGDKTSWEVEYFGGDVDFTTVGSESGDVDVAGGWMRTERVHRGDLKSGYWTWTVRRVPGGAQVDLEVDIDVTEGSMVLRTLARQDPLIRRTNALQLALEYMRVVVAFPNLTGAGQRIAAD